MKPTNHYKVKTMKVSFKTNSLYRLRCLLPSLLAAAGLLLAAATQGAAVLSPASKPYGKSYAGWSAAWWQWALSQPVTGHPFVDDPAFDVAAGQSGQVWFLASPFGTVERTCMIPTGKSLFVGLLNAEASDLEGLGATEAEQRDTAKFLADHIVDVSCVIDGIEVKKLESFRFSSPQFTFQAPSPWIFGAEGGTGTAVADGYFLMLAPLSAGTHTLHISGAFHFSVDEGDPFDFDASADLIYHLNVQ